MPAFGVEDVDFGVVEGDDDVRGCEVQTRHYALIGCDLPRIYFAACAPGCFDLVALFEVGAVAHCFGAAFSF